MPLDWLPRGPLTVREANGRMVRKIRALLNLLRYWLAGRAIAEQNEALRLELEQLAEQLSAFQNASQQPGERLPREDEQGD